MAREETGMMQIIIDGKVTEVPFHYEEWSGGRTVKVPDLQGEFISVRTIDASIPQFITDPQ